MPTAYNSGEIPLCGIPVPPSVTVYKETTLRSGGLLLVSRCLCDGYYTNDNSETKISSHKYGPVRLFSKMNLWNFMCLRSLAPCLIREGESL